jgi:hypothetical protein
MTANLALVEPPPCGRVPPFHSSWKHARPRAGAPAFAARDQVRRQQIWHTARGMYRLFQACFPDAANTASVLRAIKHAPVWRQALALVRAGSAPVTERPEGAAVGSSAIELSSRSTRSHAWKFNRPPLASW